MEPVIEFRSLQEGVKPMFACGNCRTLSLQSTANQEEAARKCCLCQECGQQLRQASWNMYCENCELTRNQDREAVEAAKTEALPVVEYDGGPVMAGDTFYADLDECVDHYYEDDIAQLVVYPCDVQPASAPDLVDFVNEHVYEQWGGWDGLSKADEERLYAVKNSLHLPQLWFPRTNERLRRTWADEPATPTYQGMGL